LSTNRQRTLRRLEAYHAENEAAEAAELEALRKAGKMSAVKRRASSDQVDDDGWVVDLNEARGDLDSIERETCVCLDSD
jgi:hypothetical protein